MSKATYAGTEVEVDAEGYLTNPQSWTKEIASAIAQAEGITLTEEHWKIISFIRDDAPKNGGQSPTIRRMQKVGNIATKTMYDLFPGGPGKKAAKIAGYRKPVGCV